ncbi:MAG: rRNA maturation RNase YbeY [Fimbriimonadales bacterium]
MKHRVLLSNSTKRRPRTAAVHAALEAMLDSEDQPPSEISVRITDSDEIRRLNRGYRGIDRPTDVLSFPAGYGPEVTELRILGDIAICLPIADEQATNNQTPLETELACLAVHGGLHLLGYDDATEPERASMVDRMNRIVTSVGLEPSAAWSSTYSVRS